MRAKSMGPNPLKLCEELLTCANIPAGSAVLDLGCGAGLTSVLMARASVLMSSTGPVILGAAAFFGRFSTQITNLVRRTAELLAILVSYFVYRVVNTGESVDEGRKMHLEAVTNRVMGLVMVASGTIMAALALFTKSEQVGNAIPSVPKPCKVWW